MNIENNTPLHPDMFKNPDYFFQAPELTSIPSVKMLITHLFNEEGPDGPLRISGIELVEPADERPEYEDCIEYLFGDKDFDDTMQRMIQTFDRTDIVPGAIALYFDGDGNLTHVGRVSETGKIISKWGPDGHVYEHSPHLVPNYYGSIEGRYRDPQLRPVDKP